jgi:hypothetical protein
MTESKKLNSFPNRSMRFDRQSLIAIDRGKIPSKPKTISAKSSQTHEMTIAAGQSGLISLPQKTVRKTSETISEFKQLEPLVEKAVLPSMEIAYLVSSSIQVKYSTTLTRFNKFLLGMGLGSGIVLVVYFCDFLLYPNYSPTYLFSLNIFQAIALLGTICGLLSIIVGEFSFKKFATALANKLAIWFNC